MGTERTGICNTPECRRLRALLSDFLDHTLHWRTARSFQAHLDACPPCRVYIASVQQTILLYRERPVVDVPPAVRQHLRELLQERHERSPRKAGRCGLGAAKRPAAQPAKRAAGSGSAPVTKAKNKP